MSNKDSSPKKLPKKHVKLMNLAFQVVVIIIGGTFAGTKLDEEYPNKNNLFTLSFSLVSVILSIIVAIRTIILTSK